MSILSATLKKIYNPKIYAADWEVAGKETMVINGEGKINTSEFLCYIFCNICNIFLVL